MIGTSRVAIVSFLFNWPSSGGGTVHTFELAKFLDRMGFDVCHIYVKYNAWGVGQVQGVLPYPSMAIEFDEQEWVLPLITARVRQATDAFCPDHVIITDSWNMKPLLAEALSHLPYILRLQALECLCPLNNVRLLPAADMRLHQCARHQLATPAECSGCLMENGRWSGPLHQAERALCEVGTREYYKKLLRAFAEAEAVLVVNPLAEAMIGPYAKVVQVVTAGMDPSRFPWPPPEEAREPWAQGRCVLFFAGLTNEPMKGFQVAYEACRRLWERRQDFVLVATMDAAPEDEEFLHCVGWLSQDDLPLWYWRSDIVIFPTVAQEALGRTAVEAMASGRPVVASRIGGLPFTVSDGATGLLCDPGNPDDLAWKLESLIDDPEARARMGRAGRRRFEEHYSWDVIIEKHYRPLLKRRPREVARR